MWELDCEESWAAENWCFWPVVLEKTLESPLNCKEIQPVHSEGDQSWVFIGRTDAEAETPILWPSHVKSWLIGKDSDAGRDWGQEEKGTTEDKMVGWHHQLNGHGFGWTLGVGDGQGGLACCDLWGRKESDMTERLNWTDVCRHLHTSSHRSSSHPHSVPYHHFSKATRLEHTTVFLKVTSTLLFMYSHIPFACWASAKSSCPSSMMQFTQFVSTLTSRSLKVIVDTYVLWVQGI